MTTSWLLGFSFLLLGFLMPSVTISSSPLFEVIDKLLDSNNDNEPVIFLHDWNDGGFGSSINVKIAMILFAIANGIKPIQVEEPISYHWDFAACVHDQSMHCYFPHFSEGIYSRNRYNEARAVSTFEDFRIARDERVDMVVMPTFLTKIPRARHVAKFINQMITPGYPKLIFDGMYFDHLYKQSLRQVYGHLVRKYFDASPMWPSWTSIDQEVADQSVAIHIRHSELALDTRIRVPFEVYTSYLTKLLENDPSIRFLYVASDIHLDTKTRDMLSLGGKLYIRQSPHELAPKGHIVQRFVKDADLRSRHQIMQGIFHDLQQIRHAKYFLGGESNWLYIVAGLRNEKQTHFVLNYLKYMKWRWHVADRFPVYEYQDSILDPFIMGLLQLH